MPININDNVVLKLSKGIKEDSVIPNLIEELRDQSIEMLNEQKISLDDCYPELINEESRITFTVYRRVKN